MSNGFISQTDCLFLQLLCHFEVNMLPLNGHFSAQSPALRTHLLQHGKLAVRFLAELACILSV